MEENLLFYLSTCQACNLFMTKCQQMDVMKKFKCVKIDGRIEYFVAKGITIVPTIIITGYSSPIVGKKCLEWLGTIEKTLNQQQMTMTTQQATPPPQINTPQENKPPSFSFDGFRQNEMTGISDNYAYKDKDDAFPMAFQTRQMNFEIKTAPELKKITTNAQPKLIKNVELDRQNDKNEFLKKFDEDYKKYSNTKNPYFLTNKPT